MDNEVLEIQGDDAIPIRGVQDTNAKLHEGVNVTKGPCGECKIALDATLRSEIKLDAFSQQQSRVSPTYQRAPYADSSDLDRSASQCFLCERVQVATRERLLLDRLENHYGHSTINKNRVNYKGYLFIDGGRAANLRVGFMLKPAFARHSLRTMVVARSMRLIICVEIQYAEHRTTSINEEMVVFQHLDEAGRAAGALPRTLFLSFLPADPRLNSEKKLLLLDQWLKRELSSQSQNERLHREIEVKRDNHPSRLLKVVDGGKAVILDGDYMRDLTALPEYVALSHRWGTCQHLTTTTANLAAHVQGISLTHLPPTFRDAVYITKRLGFTHLWIDALCIVQDDEIDWRSEAKKMGDIFLNAIFVIAAHCADDDSDGFLFRSLRKRTAFNYTLEDRTIGFSFRGNLERDVTNSALSRRAWVLQERFLAARSFHFTAGQLYIESTKGVWCEEGPLPKKAISTETTFLSPSAAPQLRYLFGATRLPETLVGYSTPREWFGLVEMYTACGMTKEEDKLVAIAGLASKIYRHTKKQWCAGIWSDQVAEGLLWVPDHEPLTKPEIPRAPSWTWAAWNGAIQYPKLVKRGDLTTRASFASFNYTGTAQPCFSLRTRLIIIESAMVPSTTMRPGLGLDKLSKDIPLPPLKSFVNVRLLHRARHDRICGDADDVVGWVQIDDVHRFDNREGTMLPLTPGSEATHFAVLGTLIPLGGAFETYLGLFLDHVGDAAEKRFTRIGVGQINPMLLEKHHSSTSDTYRPRINCISTSNLFDDNDLETIIID